MWTRLEQREIAWRIRHAVPTTAQDLPRPDLAPGTDLLPQIRHIVVLMMENHSYDNYLGMLTGRGDGFALAGDGEPDVSNPADDGTPVRAHHLKSCVQVPEIPSQSWHASHVQWDKGRNDGFARRVPGVTAHGTDLAMGYWTEEELPFYYGLARTFPLADRWFCSCLGPTFPNRRFLIAGTAHGLTDDLPFDLVDYPPNGTVFDLLGQRGISWANYHNVSHYSVILRRALGSGGHVALRRLMSLGRWYHPLVRAVRGNKQFTADLYPLGLVRALHHLRSTQRFFADAGAGSLPSFCIVDPDFEAYSEENPQDIRRGESFAAEVINRVMHGPAWPHTLLIWLYDEHGGYYDHVPPPAAPRPDDVDGEPLRALPGWLEGLLRPVFRGAITRAEAEDAGPRRYDTYGFRVPAVIVSPYARPGYVTSQVYDHTSVLKLVEQKWNLPPLTRRDAAAVAPLHALDLEGPPAFLDPPELPAPALAWGSWAARRRRRFAGVAGQGRGRRTAPSGQRSPSGQPSPNGQPSPSGQP
jgi:phospholipase C